MPITINRDVVSQINHDSGSLTPASTVVHQFSEPGEYRGLLMYDHGNTVIRTFTISVTGGRETSARSTGTAEGQAASNQREKETKYDSSKSQQLTKIDINLRNLHLPKGSAASTKTHFEIEANGYAVFRVPAGDIGGYAVEVYKSGEAGLGAKVFDSRELGKNDMLAVVLLRPGTYSVTNTIAGGKAELTVAYPEKISGQLEPIRVTCTKGAITPDKIKVHSTQGLVFSFEVSSRLKIELVTPDDRPRRSHPTFISVPPKAPSQSTSQKSETKSSGATEGAPKKSASRLLALVPRQSTTQ